MNQSRKKQNQQQSVPGSAAAKLKESLNLSHPSTPKMPRDQLEQLFQNLKEFSESKPKTTTHKNSSFSSSPSTRPTAKKLSISNNQSRQISSSYLKVSPASTSVTTTPFKFPSMPSTPKRSPVISPRTLKMCDKQQKKANYLTLGELNANKIMAGDVTQVPPQNCSVFSPVNDTKLIQKELERNFDYIKPPKPNQLKNKTDSNKKVPYQLIDIIEQIQQQTHSLGEYSLDRILSTENSKQKDRLKQNKYYDRIKNLRIWSPKSQRRLSTTAMIALSGGTRLDANNRQKSGMQNQQQMLYRENQILKNSKHHDSISYKRRMVQKNHLPSVLVYDNSFDPTQHVLGKDTIYRDQPNQKFKKRIVFGKNYMSNDLSGSLRGKKSMDKVLSKRQSYISYRVQNQKQYSSLSEFSKIGTNLHALFKKIAPNHMQQVKLNNSQGFTGSYGSSSQSQIQHLLKIKQENNPIKSEVKLFGKNPLLLNQYHHNKSNIMKSIDDQPQDKEALAENEPSFNQEQQGRRVNYVGAKKKKIKYQHGLSQYGIPQNCTRQQIELFNQLNSKGMEQFCKKQDLDHLAFLFKTRSLFKYNMKNVKQYLTFSHSLNTVEPPKLKNSIQMDMVQQFEGLNNFHNELTDQGQFKKSPQNLDPNGNTRKQNRIIQKINKNLDQVNYLLKKKSSPRKKFSHLIGKRSSDSAILKNFISQVTSDNLSSNLNSANSSPQKSHNSLNLQPLIDHSSTAPYSSFIYTNKGPISAYQSSTAPTRETRRNKNVIFDSSQNFGTINDSLKSRSLQPKPCIPPIKDFKKATRNSKSKSIIKGEQFICSLKQTQNYFRDFEVQDINYQHKQMKKKLERFQTSKQIQGFKNYFYQKFCPAKKALNQSRTHKEQANELFEKDKKITTLTQFLQDQKTYYHQSLKKRVLDSEQKSFEGQLSGSSTFRIPNKQQDQEYQQEAIQRRNKLKQIQEDQRKESIAKIKGNLRNLKKQIKNFNLRKILNIIEIKQRKQTQKEMKLQNISSDQKLRKAYILKNDQNISKFLSSKKNALI